MHYFTYSSVPFIQSITMENIHTAIQLVISFISKETCKMIKLGCKRWVRLKQTVLL